MSPPLLSGLGGSVSDVKADIANLEAAAREINLFLNHDNQKSSSLMAAVSKAFTSLPRKSDRSDAEVGERRESHTLRFGKCL